MPQILASSTTVSDALAKIKEVDPDHADELSTIALGETNYNSFKKDMMEFDPIKEDQKEWAKGDRLLEKTKRRIAQAESEQVAGVRLQIPLSATNLGQTPVTVSKFAVLSTVTDKKIIVPVTIDNPGSRVIIPPVKTVELLLNTPRKDEIPDTWADLEHARNDQQAVANVGLLSFEENEVIVSPPFAIARGTDIRHHSIDSIVGFQKAKITADDVNHYLEKIPPEASTRPEQPNSHD